MISAWILFPYVLWFIYDIYYFKNLENLIENIIKGIQNDDNYFIGDIYCGIFRDCALILSVVYGIALIIFFTSVINFSGQKYFILTGIIATLLLMTYFSLRIWTNWIRSLRQKIEGFNLDEEK